MRYFIFMSLAFLFCACEQNNSASTSTPVSEVVSVDGPVSVEEFKKGLTDLSSIQLIDVRTPEEFAAGAIPGAKNINYYDADFDVQIAKLDKEKPVYIYCRSGGRSGKSYAKLKEMGFTQVYDLKEGFNGWPDK